MSALRRLLLPLEQRLVYPREWVSRDDGVVERLAGLTQTWIHTPEGAVEAWLLAPLPARDRPAPVVLFAHGNGELIDHWAEELEPYRRLGCFVLLPEYRGYGRSKGTPLEPALVDDTLRALQWATNQPGVDRARVVFHGRSLGGGVVAQLVRTVRPSCVVLESTFTSLVDVAGGLRVPRALVTNRFESIAPLRAAGVPMLVMHGEHDVVVPFTHARAIAQRVPGTRLVAFACGHNDLPRSERYWSEIRDLLGNSGVR